MTTRIDAQELIDVSRQWTGLTDFGDILPTGALGPMISVAPGDQIVARIGALGSAAFYLR